MKARGMLWRRVVDTSQEDRCDRRISTPVPSGLRSHHAFTALWKLLLDEHGLAIHDGITTHHLPPRTLVDTVIGRALHSRELQPGDECCDQLNWVMVDEHNLARLQGLNTFLPIRRVVGETRMAHHWSEQSVHARFASSFPLWVDGEGHTWPTLTQPPVENVVTVLVPLSLFACDVMIGEQLDIGGQGALVTRAEQDERSLQVHLSVLLPGYGPLHFTADPGELLPMRNLHGAS